MQQNKLSGWTQRLERWFVIYLFINPVLDILNGMFMLFVRNMHRYMPSFATPITPTLVIRMAVLVVMGLYLLMKKDWKSVKLLLPIAIAGALSVVVEFLFMDTHDFFADVQYLARFMYNAAALFVVIHALKSSGRRTAGESAALLRKVFTFSAIVVSSSILFCFITGMGFHSYADRFGLRGTSGFYYAANEATAVLMLLLPLSIHDFLQIGELKNKKNWAMLLTPALVCNAILLIGTKTGYIALAVSVVLMGGHALWRSAAEKSYRRLLRYVLMLASVVLVFGLLTLVSSSKMVESISETMKGVSDVYTEDVENTDLSRLPNEMQEMLRNTHPLIRTLLSGRQYYLAKTATQWADVPAAWLFGIGRGSQTHVVEMDLFEILFYYGVFGFIVLCLPYVRAVWPLFGTFVKRRTDTLFFAIFLSLGLTFFYLAIAGHVLFSVTGGFYLALVIVYGRLLREAAEEADSLPPPPGGAKKKKRA